MKRSIEKNKTKDETVQSKYFTLDSFFSSSKRLKSNEDQKKNSVVREHFEDQITLKKEQCPLCQAFIYTESMSMEVHVNYCLDKQQHIENNKEKEDPINDLGNDELEAIFEENIMSEEKDIKETQSDISSSLPSQCSIASLKEKFSFNNTQTMLEKENIMQSTVVTKSNSTMITPDKWKSVFSAKNTTVLETKFINNSQLNNKKICPLYKYVKDTQFVVDAFNYGPIPNCDGYFLSHFHSDHYGGLRSNWSYGPIYCSQVTANLVKQELKVDSRYIKPLPLNTLHPITDNIKVGLIDANHCPGSVLFLFIIQLPNKVEKRHLHTGDFRATPRICLHPLLRQQPIDCLYLDTTYLNAKYAFPAQEECIEAVCDAVQKELEQIEKINAQNVKRASVLENWFIKQKQSLNSMITSSNSKSRVLIVVGTYTIGKERVFINVAKMLKCKIYAPLKKKRILLCQEDEDLKSMLTNDPKEAQVHVVPLRDIKADIMTNYLDEYKSSFDYLIGFKPTGWAYKSFTHRPPPPSKEEEEMDIIPCLADILKPPTDRKLQLSPYCNREKVRLYAVPYSEHSSFRELASFITSLDIQQQIIPTVNTSKSNMMSTLYFNPWKKDKEQISQYLTKEEKIVIYSNENYW
ncbi:DNA repair metallo-beta-lactamase-domain-containing protein [Cokeromyces recurvatus]|uniref:DNA repair metallo-beta-lactamase-domain-containing protein n=1 Tax=Cokeromyces recurvatus TaxID=90255 RepID=UPI0022204DC5|nr:DNA repair metallo-beta-lactamase-domain-containing protein [Cokeromyces recurvatus]KAI7902868.1 DNA repair metallo-beta-lactamase-domain-containing protein [Cokeromyces recurvatus]